MPVTFQFQKIVPLQERKRLKAFIEKMCFKEGKEPGNLSFVFCSDDYLLNINKEFLSHDYFTDIITFDLSEPSGKLDAEIYISGDRVKENASSFQQPFKRELHRVIFHGILHLCGYGDKTAAQKEVIRKKEDTFLRAYFR